MINNMEKVNNKQGISLIVLVITIIVMIILAGSIILTLNNNGIIEKASDAVESTDIANMKNLATMLWSEEYVDLEGKATVEELRAAVLAGLFKADPDYAKKYNVDVTESGVDVTDKSVYFNRPYVNKITDANGEKIEEIYVFYEDGSAEKYDASGFKEKDIAIGTCIYSSEGVKIDNLTFVFDEDGYTLVCDGNEYSLDRELIHFYVSRGYSGYEFYYKAIYFAEVDMTWSSWCKSKYNIFNYKIQNERVKQGESPEHLFNDETHSLSCTSTEIIIKGRTYYQDCWEV